MFDFRVPYSQKHDNREDEVEEAHESFGLVGIHRVTGHKHLFGSEIEHGAFFRLQVSQARVRHSHGRDWYNGGRELISIYLSAAQFAEMITTLNVGQGVPCTIDRVLGEQMEEPPKFVKNETEKIRDAFKGRIDGVVSFLRDQIRISKPLLDKKSLTQADRKIIFSTLESTLQEIERNAPFIVKSFQEAAEKVETTAKAEIETYMTLVLNRMGLDAARKQLETGREDSLPSSLPSSKILAEGEKA